MEISIKNLTKTYGDEMVLDNISFEIKGRRAVGIIGESGCGKTTLLRILSGIEPPNSGEVEINGVSPIGNIKEFRNKIGVVFQKHNLFPHLTIKQNITIILHRIKKLSSKKSDKKAEELLAKLFIENEADKKPSEVSGGQAQRASIARALATDPELIFLDEPTAALDPLLTDEVLKAVTQLKQDGRNFIFVTHEISFLKEFADYIIFLKNGKICESGAAECLVNPTTDELAEFLKIQKR